MTPGLHSIAEQEAAKALQLEPFHNFALLGIKSQVAEILAMVGREGIFSTYSKHDISHIDTMVEMLDWLVPPSTREVMTPTDWLLVVLSIYLHDLGMIVTANEFERRHENEAFVAFRGDIDASPKLADYRARAPRKEPARERFYYQEYIRKTHASRVREWITGRHSHSWQEPVQSIAVEVENMLAPLPPRFREHLGAVAESHNRNDLDVAQKYPLCHKYGRGSNPDETANVQYAAILLRTADLLHVTKDRTPSVMFRLINLTDPLGVDEWDKQRGTSTVSMIGRTLLEDDPKTHVIVVTADFLEERPFFALTEYLSWAGRELAQCKRWADTSQGNSDGRGFSFPWRSIRGDIRVEGNEPQPLRFELDRGRLLDLLVGHTIYNNATVAVRELLQNAIDAVRFQHFTEARRTSEAGIPEPEMGTVLVEWDPTARMLQIEDTGTGMDRDVIENHLMLVGASFYNTASFVERNRDFTPISRFGIGILTCFMMSDDVEIITVKGNVGHRLRMSSVHADYLLKVLPLEAVERKGLGTHGTRVRVRLRETIELSALGMEDIVRHWVILPACSVSYREVGQEAVRIGYDCPADAIRAFQQGEAGRGDDASAKHRIQSKSLLEGNGSFELAYDTVQSWRPGWTFSRQETELPSVCVEGIRADHSIPGYKKDLNALLAVSGNKQFRTTVSRDQLERDDEYYRVALVASDLFLVHVREEVGRVAGAPGRPLSQASSAGLWITKELRESTTSPKVRKHIDERLRAQPLAVLERINTVAGKPVTDRNLISLESLAKLTAFWTVESRLADSIGIISRDLERELSVNEFLQKMAPEFADSEITPIVSDAHQLDRRLQESHCIAECRFSRARQQSVMLWEPRAEQDAGWVKPLVGEQSYDKEAFEIAIEHGVESSSLSAYGSRPKNKAVRRLVCQRLANVMAAPVAGDIQGIQVVVSRSAIVIDKESDVWRVLTQMCEALDPEQCDSSTDSQRACVLAGILLLVGFLLAADDRLVGMRDGDRPMFVSAWRRNLPALTEALGSFGADSHTLARLAGIENAKKFNARELWRDWFGTLG